MIMTIDDFGILHPEFVKRFKIVFEYVNLKKVVKSEEMITIEEFCEIHLDGFGGDLISDIINGLIYVFNLPVSLIKEDEFDMYDELKDYLTDRLENDNYIMSDKLDKVLKALPYLKDD